jgi:hypothetical protein
MVTLDQVVSFRQKGWNFKNISVLNNSSEANNLWSPDLRPLRTTQNVLLLFSQVPATAASLGSEGSTARHISFIYVLILYSRLFLDFHSGLFLPSIYTPPCVLNVPLLSLHWCTYISNVCRNLPVMKILWLIWTCIFLHSPVNVEWTTPQTTSHASGLAVSHTSGSLKVLLSVDLVHSTMRHTSQIHVKVSSLFSATNLTVKAQICCSRKHSP